MIQLAIHEAINGRDLDYAIARATMEEMMDGTATDIEMATLLTALRMKGETITEITACAEVMREKGAHIEPKGAVMDIVGTGGDEVGSFNISTTAAFVAAAGGVPVAKHGNRSVSSKSGAADVLEQLGVGYDRIEEAGYSGPVLEVSCQYKTMSKFGETVRIEASITQYNGVRMTLHYDVFDKATGEVRCTGDSRHCFINAEGKPAILKRCWPEFDAALAANTVKE